jgi:hypothetical protein
LAGPDWGDGFEVEKAFGLHQKVYHVHLDRQGQTCDFKGFLRWGHCKHAAALAALRQPNFPPRNNIAPTQEVPVIGAAGAGRELLHLRWGLVPSWAKDKNIGVWLINGKADTVPDKPSYCQFG